MSEPKTLKFGGQTLPIDLAAFVSVEAGALSRKLAPIKFDFVYADIRFVCRCEDTGEILALKLIGDVGPLPFTAESPHGRMALNAIIDEANSVLGPVFKIGRGRILLGHDCTLPRPLTATVLVAAAAAFLVPARPYLDLIAEVIRPPLAPSKPGESSVRPGWRRVPVKAVRN